MVKNFRFGLLGLGNLGRNVLLQVVERTDRFPLYWVADSSRIISRKDGKKLTASDVAKITRAKRGKKGLGGLPASFAATDFEGAKEEARILSEIIQPALDEWVVFDTTYLDARSAYGLASELMGALAICTANKTAWADPPMCRDLFSRARKQKTFLGLNCTQGVWIDQMEYVPVAASRLSTRTVHILKRDNSSLNFLFSRASEGLSPGQIYQALTDGGYLEPGGTDLLPEIKDQQTKARITTNICAILGRLEVRSSKQSVPEVLASGPGSASVDDLCAWHISGRKCGYPSLVTEIVMDGSSRTMTCCLSFQILERKHPLGRSFHGANAFSIAVAQGGKSFTHRGGPGGSVNTARRLIREAEEVMRLSGGRQTDSFSPIPILTGLSAGDKKAESRTRTLRELLDQDETPHSQANLPFS